MIEVTVGARRRRWSDEGHHVADEQCSAQRQQDPDDQIVTQHRVHGVSVPPGVDRSTALRETLAMGFHHVALATRDTAATHRFYTEVMGFHLVKVNVAPTPGEHGGWAKHFFYATNEDRSSNSGMIAFWEIHDSEIGEEFAVDINTHSGLPWWVNHIAFDAPTSADLERHRQRWRQHGQTVLEIDHDFCVSIYIRDPNNNMVEFCHTTREFTADELGRAEAILREATPGFDRHEPNVTVHQPVVAGTNA